MRKKKDLGSFGGRKITAVAGEGFKKTFTDKEWSEIERLRQEMHDRVFRIG